MTRLEDGILLKIHRQFGMDESVKALVDEIVRLRQEVGILQSEKAELEDKLPKKPISKKIDSAWNKDAYILDLKKQIKTQYNKRVQQAKNTKHWQKLYFKELNKQ